MFDINVLAENIKKHRIESGLKQFELADKLFISPQAVSKWEQGVSMPDIENLCALSELFGVTVDELLMNKYVRESLMIAVDGGGTKTEFLLFTESGRIKRRIILDGCNPSICGMESTFKILKTGIDSLCSFNTEITGIYCSIAGTLAGNNRKRLKDFLHNTYSGVISECNSDIFSVTASVTDTEKCIAVICGTGSNVCGINGNKLYRVGGWGYLFDGKGSGFDIGRDAVSAVLAESDGIGPKTMLTELIEKKLGGSIWNSINYIYAKDKSFIAQFAETVLQAYKAGDKVATEIVESNIKALTDKINFIAEKYDCGNTVIISGGIINEKDVLIDVIRKNLDKGLEVVIPTLPQIFGACRLCCKCCNVGSDSFTQNFSLDYEQHIKRV